MTTNAPQMLGELARLEDRGRGRRRRMSPGRVQYLRFKAQHQDALLLYRMGDFYECFDEDAHTLSRVLDVALTSRDVGGGEKSALAGIPYHALDNYIGKLIGAGLKVAIAEQTSDTPGSDGIVDRAVVRMVTPGTVLDSALLEQSRPNYLMACIVDGETAGLAWLDGSIGEFAAMEVPSGRVVDEMERIAPSEVLADARAFEMIEAREDVSRSTDPRADRPVVRRLDGAEMDHEDAAGLLKRHFDTPTLEPFDLEGSEVATRAAAAAISYLVETQMGNAPYIATLRRHRSDRYMHVSVGALRDLDILDPSTPGGPTLLEVLDHTQTPMGARLLRSWLVSPLMDLTELRVRQRTIERLHDDIGLASAMRLALGDIPDLERLVAKLSQLRVSPREMRRLASGLSQCPELVLLTTASTTGEPMSQLFDGITSHDEVRQLIDSAIVDDPSTRVTEADVIRDGFDSELDGLRAIARDGRTGIAEIETEARDSTGIRSLKVGYNKVFGYYLEVSRPNLSYVPEHWERRQTLVNGERYVTPELKRLEAKVNDASLRIEELQQSIFERVVAQVAEHAAQISRTAAAIARLDVCISLAEAGREGGWVMPVLDTGNRLWFEEARHPIVESVLGPGRFVPNTLDISNRDSQVLIITGPNMSGKSTYIRQAAVLVLMSQIGSMVPATSARLGLVDRIFTRVGASDDLAGGRSTFMVEMVETASMLNQATTRSLAILDEIGRGTSTYDGLAIARAVVEFIHDSQTVGCKTLFATHYHEMTEVGETLERARNLRVEVAEDGSTIAFLYRIVPGGADRSYGVQVARLAGMPASVITRALEILGELESGAARSRDAVDSGDANNIQLGMFAAGQSGTSTEPSAALRTAADTEIEELTPLEAMNLLADLRRMAQAELAGQENH